MKQKLLLLVLSVASVLSLALRFPSTNKHRHISPSSSTKIYTYNHDNGDDVYATATTTSSGEEVLLQDKLQANDIIGAFSILKRNPMINLNREDARVFLNNIDSLEPKPSNSNEINERKLLDTCVYLYKRFERQHVLRGFGCISNDEYPEKSGDISASKLQSISGVPIDALTPARKTGLWFLAGVSLFLGEYALGTSIGVDPLYTFIPLSFLLFGIDQLRFQGAYFESFYQSIFPEYREKIIDHEAGHFLVAYLLGLPIRGCVTNAWDGLEKYPGLGVQAGTIYYDTKLQEEIANQKVSRISLDRLSIVTMAGIAAEALKYGKAEGGVMDEQQLIGFFTSLQQPWNLLRIQEQARWAALQAILILKEHKESYAALVDALTEKKSVGDCILAIEDNLPTVLPSLERKEAKKSKKRSKETDMIVRFVRKMTWQVGGIGTMTDVEKDMYEADSDGFLKMVTKKGGEGENDNKSSSDVDERSKVIDDFTTKIRSLEQAAALGRIDLDIVPPSDSRQGAAAASGGGGVWINQLKSLEGVTSAVDESVQGMDNNDGSNKSVQSFAIAGVDNSTYSVVSMLESHRGYQLKRIENIERNYITKIRDIDAKLQLLKGVDA